MIDKLENKKLGKSKHNLNCLREIIQNIILQIYNFLKYKNCQKKKLKTIGKKFFYKLNTKKI